MALTSKEEVDIKSGMIILERSVSDLTRMQSQNTAAQTKLSDGITELLVEMRERDVRDEHLKSEVSIIKSEHTAIMAEYLPVMQRAKRSQQRWDSFWASVTTNWGRLASIAIVVAIAMALGLDITKIFKL